MTGNKDECLWSEGDLACSALSFPVFVVCREQSCPCDRFDLQPLKTREREYKRRGKGRV